jgi:acetoacetate decarboxylase
MKARLRWAGYLVAGARELWGCPNKLADPFLRSDIDMLVGSLDWGGVRVAAGTCLGARRVSDSFQDETSLTKIIVLADRDMCLRNHSTR